jgi:hypothetical protein
MIGEYLFFGGYGEKVPKGNSVIVEEFLIRNLIRVIEGWIYGIISKEFVIVPVAIVQKSLLVRSDKKELE